MKFHDQTSDVNAMAAYEIIHSAFGDIYRVAHRLEREEFSF